MRAVLRSRAVDNMEEYDVALGVAAESQRFLDSGV
jgi:hypothetical protein